MKSRGFVVLAGIISLSVALCLSNAFGWDSEYRQGFALSNLVELSDLIVVGRVTQKDFVRRQNIEGEITTDVTVTVTEVVKGTPNAGTQQVKFIYLGGEYIDPITGELCVVTLTHEPEFSVDEEILLFLYNADGTRYENYPYDGVQVSRGDYGKRLIKDDTVTMLYAMDDDKLKPVEMPLDLAVKLAKAADKEKERVVSLENDIKSAMRHHVGSDIGLSESLIERLTKEAQKVIDKHAKPKTQE